MNKKTKFVSVVSILAFLLAAIFFSALAMETYPWQFDFDLTFLSEDWTEQCGFDVWQHARGVVKFREWQSDGEFVKGSETYGNVQNKIYKEPRTALRWLSHCKYQYKAIAPNELLYRITGQSIIADSFFLTVPGYGPVAGTAGLGLIWGVEGEEDVVLKSVGVDFGGLEPDDITAVCNYLDSK